MFSQMRSVASWIGLETRAAARGARNRAGADFGRGEAVRMMQRDMPRAFATLRESAEDDALVVDIEALLHGGDGLEDVHFAGPMPARAIDAAEAIELDLSLVGDRRVAGRPWVQEAVDELGFGGVVLPAVQPDVETGRFARDRSSPAA